MAAYRRFYDSRHLHADWQESGSAPEPYAQQSSMGYLPFKVWWCNAAGKKQAASRLIPVEVKRLAKLGTHCTPT